MTPATIAMRTTTTDGGETREPRGLFCAVMAGSVALHAALASIAPSAGTVRPAPTALPSFVEMIDPPPAVELPVEPPISKEPSPKPAARPPRAPITRAHVTAPVAPPPTAAPTAKAPTALPPATAQPVDVASMVLSSTDGADRAGVTVALPAAPPFTDSVAGASAPGATAATPLGPRFVAFADLAQPPRAPRLDAALEKNYPADARQSGIAGSAVLRVQVLFDGRIGAVRRVSETYPGFADACERTVKSAAWEPPLDRDGHAVATVITYKCRFDVKT